MFDKRVQTHCNAYNRIKTDISTCGAQKTEYSHKREERERERERDLYLILNNLTSLTKINSNRLINPSVKGKTTKFLGDNIKSR
jgi:hypothetical protein